MEDEEEGSQYRAGEQIQLQIKLGDGGDEKRYAGDAGRARHRFGGWCPHDGSHLGRRRLHQRVRTGPKTSINYIDIKLYVIFGRFQSQ